jgi:hypothetical protein
MQHFVWEVSPRPHGDCSPLDVTPYYPVVITYRCLDEELANFDDSWANDSILECDLETWPSLSSEY